MIELNENQKRRLLASLGHVDQLLMNVEQVLTSEQSTSLFKQFSLDVTPKRQKLIEEHTAELRKLMQRAVERLGIPLSHRISGLQAIVTSLMFINLDLEEANSRRLRGYGELSDESAAELDRMLSEMRALVERLQVELEKDRVNSMG